MCNGNCKCKENDLVLAVPEEGKNVKTRGIGDIKQDVLDIFFDRIMDSDDTKVKGELIHIREEILAIFDKE